MFWYDVMFWYDGMFWYGEMFWYDGMCWYCGIYYCVCELLLIIYKYIQTNFKRVIIYFNQKFNKSTN